MKGSGHVEVLLLTFFKSRLKASRPDTAVTNFRLFRSTRLIVMTLLAILLACFCSAFSACAVFFWASLAALFCASTDREAVAASRASIERKKTGFPRSVF